MNENKDRTTSESALAAPLNLSQRVLKFIGLRLLLGLTIAVMTIVFFGWLADEVIEGETSRFDETVRLFVHGLASPTMTELMRLSTFIGSTLFLIGLGICVSIGFYYLGWRRALGLFVITMSGAIILNLTLKTGFHRARPVPYFDTPLPSSYSFPSGHALFSVCFYGVLAWLVTRRIKNWLAQISIWMLSILLIFLIGLSRIYLGVHFPSDVIAGYAAAFVWVLAVALGDSMIKRPQSTT